MDIVLTRPSPASPGEFGRRSRSRIDLGLVLSTALLIVIGMVSVYAATRNPLLAQGRSGNAYLVRDLVNLVVGLLLATPLLLIDYRHLRPWAPWGYAVVLTLLVAVLTPLGSTVNGAHGWFSIGPVQLEPSEFTKLAVILLLASVLSQRRDRELAPAWSDIVLALTVAGLPVVLILAEPALGIALVICVIVAGLLALSDAPGLWIASLLGGALLAGTLAFSLHLLKPYQQERFTYFTNPHAAATSTGYQIEQSRIAIGSGGLTGQGFLAGSQTEGGFIPEQQTDFIFTVSAEEGGLLAGTVLLLAVGLLLWRGITIGSRAPDLYGRLIAGGIVSWFAFQSFVNIGMTLGIMPVTGLPLPFVSYGGSSLFANLLGVAFLLNIHRRSSPQG